ncbi:hypothetical protein [Kribbella kalugense]|uniref:Uncharacterized protein n=1 Tax=Kribbella kalugense TaxID=2512221 RepID=A0A4R7ZHG6_9ACTN|nr:hypothetical protein [Kribbella kalugense]TDW15821.1 hypothetical protein EV650_7315 [Kribbella kalugense]
MAGELLRLGTEYFWATSIIEAVDPVGGHYAAERWNGQVLVTDGEPSLALQENLMNSTDRPLILPRRHLETVREAIGRQNGDLLGKPASQLQDLVEATGYATSQAVELTCAIPDLQGNPGSGPETQLNSDLADIVTRDQLAMVWHESDSAELMPAGDLPSPEFSWPGRSASTAATRELLTAIVTQQGWEPTPANISATAHRLIAVPPDRRWAATTGMLLGADEPGRADLRELAGGELRRGFEAAVREPETGAAALAVRGLLADPQGAARRTAMEALDAGQHLYGIDPALVPARGAVAATPARTPGSDAASVQPQLPADSDVRRSPRSDRDRGGRH